MFSDRLRSRWIGLGTQVADFEQEFATYKQAPYAQAESSGSAALHLALIALNIGPGDEVFVPTMTFCATAHAVDHVGATPVFVDCDPFTYNITAQEIEAKLTRRSRAIIVVHMGGRACEMGLIMALAVRWNVRFIEDCAHAIESGYWGSTRRDPW